MIEFLLILIVLFLFGGLMLTGLGGFLGVGVAAFSKRQVKKAEANAPAILDAAFAGDPVVAVNVNLESLPYERVVTGAIERGYTLTAQHQLTPNASTLVFEKVTPPVS